MCPVIYSVEDLVEGWRGFYHIDPRANVMEGVRWSVFGGDAPGLGRLAVSLAGGLIVLATGFGYFRSREGD